MSVLRCNSRKEGGDESHFPAFLISEERKTLIARKTNIIGESNFFSRLVKAKAFPRELGSGWNVTHLSKESSWRTRRGRGPSARTERSSHNRKPIKKCYLPANSRFTASLTIFPSTRMPAPEKRAMAFFITVPMSFIVGEPISEITALTPASTSASPTAFGR